MAALEALSGNAESFGAAERYLDEAVKCFLCDFEFVGGEEPWLLFEKRDDDETSLATILSSALGYDLQEATAHSSLLCELCKCVVLEYETLEQRFCEMRFRILSSYNVTAKKNSLQPIAVEVNGVLQDIYQTAAEKPEEQQDDSTAYLLPKEPEEEAATTNMPEHAETRSQDDIDEEQEFMEQLQPDAQSMESQENLYATDNEEISQMLGYDDIIIEDYRDESSRAEAISVDGQNEDTTFMNSGHEMFSDVKAEDENSLLTEVMDDPGNLSTDDDSAGYFMRDGSDFLCEMCLDPLPLGLDDFVSHMQNLHDVAIFVCELCCKAFMAASDLEEHKEAAHQAGFAQLKCSACQQTFPDGQKLAAHCRLDCRGGNRHTAATSPQADGLHECPACSKKYVSRHSLQLHMKVHEDPDPANLHKCPTCSKDFASKYSLQVHMKIHEDRQRDFPCDECDKSFMRLHNLKQHKKLHSGKKDFVCEVCAKSFSTQQNLAVHKVVHSGVKPFACRICGKAFARRAEIRDHERIHTGERPFACDMCPAAFAQRSNLMSHKRTTHMNKKLHTCDLCNRSFKRRRLLDYHVRSVHTGERPYKCPICNAGFVYPEHYKKHMIIHAPSKPFACEVCGKEFNSRDNRNAHRFVHSSKKPYECVKCGAGFMRKPLLYAHMKHAGHISDTIIMNQPVIKGYDFTSKGAVNVNRQGAHQYVDVDGAGEMHDEDGELLEEAEDAGSDLTKLAEDLLSGDVKYLQFEEMDGDGRETLTWVDIGEGNE